MKKVEFHYREALRLNPQHPNARDNIDRFFSSSGARDDSQSQIASPREKKGKKGKKGKKKEEKQAGGDDNTGGRDGRGGGVKDLGGIGGDGAAANVPWPSGESQPKGKEDKRKSASKKEGSGGSKGKGRQTGDAGDGQVAGMSTWGIQEYEAALAAGVCAGKVEKNCRNNLGVLLFQNGKGIKALKHLDRAVELDPSWAEATYNLGYVKKELAKGKGSTED